MITRMDYRKFNGVPHYKKPSRMALFKLALILVSISLMLLYSITLPTWKYSGDIVDQFIDESLITKDDDQHFNYNSSYFVNTAGCKMPSLPIVDKYIQTFLEKVPPLNCTPALIQSDSSSIWFQLNEKEIKKHYELSNASLIQCCYRPFERKSNNKVRMIKKKISFKFGEKMEIKDEFIEVSCTHPAKKKKKKEFYKDYFAFVPMKQAVEKRCEKTKKDLKARLAENDEKLSIMILGLDSVSRLNFHRQMKQTAEMVIDRLNGVEMFGYNKVGDNTYPNLVPALTGLNVDELETACLPHSNSTFDLCPFIWRKFSDLGYRTFYTEDSSKLDTFNYFKNGFRDQPTDYYLRNFYREADSSIGYNKKMNSRLCLGGRNPTHVLVEYARKIVSAMKNRLSFSLLWACTMTHDFLNNPSLVDDDYKGLLEYMERQGVLNNTAVILLSDHGIRWGSYRRTYQGMMEERQPFLFFVLPKWFQHRYPSAYRNLRKNRQQLTTPFDLHETLEDLASLSLITDSSVKLRSLELLEAKSLPRGISLFLPISPTRTCENAGIASHWCTCHDYKSIDIKDYRVIAVARFTVDSLNQMLEVYPQCAVLHLHSIEAAHLGVSTEEIISRKPKHQFSDISVRFLTNPGDAEFEATVRIDSFNRSSLTGSISRTTLYGKQSYCVDDYRMKLYCFCTQ